MIQHLLEGLQPKVAKWREEEYPGIEKETRAILTHIKSAAFLHEPQVEAFETYVYLKEVANNPTTPALVNYVYSDRKSLLLALGLSPEELIDLLSDPEKAETKVDELIRRQYGELDYSNAIYALAMGTGKTILMGTMVLYEFVLSYYHPEDPRFGKNALIFAPDTTIVESLKEIKTFDYSLVLPREYHFVALNIKYHYLETPETPLNPIGHYNLIVSNSQKIILKVRHNQSAQKALFDLEAVQRARAIENNRLQAIRELEGLVIFVDEAHHSFGTTLEGSLKRTREMINHLHREGKTPLVSVANLTGTPYINNRMLPEVVYFFGLKQGIDRGILKQVRFIEYNNVQETGFIEDVIDKFWNEYGEERLEDRLPKMALYAPSIDVLRTDVRPVVERVLIRKGITPEKILEYHTEAEAAKDEFTTLDTPQSGKQFVLLVGKGTEGWNCRSLAACALYRRPTSAIFVLQSATRCLRSIGDNSVPATVFLSRENAQILDRELKANFSTSMEELRNQEQSTVEHLLVVEKTKRLKIRKVTRRIVSVTQQEAESIRVDWTAFDAVKYKPFVVEKRLYRGQQASGRLSQGKIESVDLKADFTFYEIVSIINSCTHLPCLQIAAFLERNSESREALVRQVNEAPAVLGFVIETLLSNVYRYEEEQVVQDEEIELTKRYPFRINVDKSRNSLVVYKKDFSSESRLGFHINPYNFDSGDELDLFRALSGSLSEDESISDIYFTGGVTDASHNDFYFEYFSPESKRLCKYFPDFLIETNRGRFLVVEVKTSRERSDYEANKREYDGQPGTLRSEVFAKEIGFGEFQEHNRNFEYRIIFDAGLQAIQTEVVKQINEFAA